MPEFDFTSINFSWLLIIDAVIVLTVMSMIFIFSRRRGNVRIFLIFAAVVFLYLAIAVLYVASEGTAFFIARRGMELLIVLMVAAFAVVYQSDLKSLFMRFSSRYSKGFAEYTSNDDELKFAASEIVKACQNMSKNDTGAIIVIAPTTVPRSILDTGTEIGAVVSAGLLESIFNTSTPLHDGAVIIRENRILAAGCFLPLSGDISISKELGTRHRAALGVTEETNMVAIVVSEESGVISVAKDGELKRYMTSEKLMDEIEDAYLMGIEK